MDRYFIVKLAVITFLWYVNITAYIAVKDLEPLKGFVPFEILGVDKNAPVSAIKKAYR